MLPADAAQIQQPHREPLRQRAPDDKRSEVDTTATSACLVRTLPDATTVPRVACGGCLLATNLHTQASCMRHEIVSRALAGCT